VEQGSVHFMDAIEQPENLSDACCLSLTLRGSGFPGFFVDCLVTGTHFAMLLARHAAGGKGSSGAVSVASAQVPTINDQTIFGDIL
jgi:hypothetical protein